MIDRAGCPDRTTLERHARHELSSDEAGTVDWHLTSCRDCLDRVLELHGRSLIPDIPDCHAVKEIGRGRFGVVYKAWWWRDSPRLVALKVLNRGGRMEEGRFDREIAVLQRIDAPGIVKCLHSGTAGGTKYYLMDYVEGAHLDDYLTTSGGDLNAKLLVLQRVCRAVAAAHAQGVVHRDLKPGNILIDAEGRPHILDFGICAVDHADWSSWDRLTITQTGDIIGTLRYMSPEQAWGGVAGPVDERSDVWSLGVLLYELVTEGGYPYSLRSTPDKPAHEALLERIRKELPRLPRLDSLPRGRDLEVLLERCLVWERRARIQTAAQLADDIERYRAARRIHTRPLGLPYRLKRLAVAAATRSRWACAAVFVALLGVTLWAAALPFDVGWYVTGHQYHVSGDQSAEPIAGGHAGENVLIVGVFDDTIEAVVDFATRQRIEGVTASVPTWRAVHGFLMRRLAPVRPRAVVWDYYFRTLQNGDAPFAAGAMALEEAGSPVILAAFNYDGGGRPDLSPGLTGPLAERLRHGAIVARDMVERPGEFVIAFKRPDRTVVPGLALTTLVAVLHPDARLDLDWPDRSKSITLHYQLAPGAYSREHDRVELTKVFEAGRSDQAVRAGDLLACSTLALTRPEQWERQSVPYQRLLTCPQDELRTLVGGKVLIIGDLRKARLGFVPDRHPVEYEALAGAVRDVPGCYLMADAIVSLLDRRYVKSAFPLAPGTFGFMLLAAGVGCLLPVWLCAVSAIGRPSYRCGVWIVVLGLAALAFVVMTASRNYTAVHLGMAGFSLLAPMAGSLWVEFARNRHRILDRSRRAIDDVRTATEGTLTLSSRRWRSLPESG
ncbi:MAG TPA: protein kinase [Phycisphaerae bacterium]|nr:protein kinase [Phycisphaerae bacterium]